MKINKIANKSLRVLLCSTALYMFTGQAYAELWSCIHGNTGHIEYEQRIEDTGRTHIGWGLDFVQKPGLLNWIHFAPSTVFGQKTRFVAIQFLTGSVDAFVKHVHVYDLGKKVKEFNDVDWSGSLQTRILDLGSERAFAALSISVAVGAGVESLSHRFQFTGACASAN